MNPRPRVREARGSGSLAVISVFLIVLLATSCSRKTPSEVNTCVEHRNVEESLLEGIKLDFLYEGDLFSLSVRGPAGPVSFPVKKQLVLRYCSDICDIIHEIGDIDEYVCIGTPQSSLNYVRLLSHPQSMGTIRDWVGHDVRRWNASGDPPPNEGGWVVSKIYDQLRLTEPVAREEGEFFIIRRYVVIWVVSGSLAIRELTERVSRAGTYQIVEERTVYVGDYPELTFGPIRSFM